MESENKTTLTNCGFYLQLADPTCNLRISFTVVGSASAQFNDTNVVSFVCGFHNLFWIAYFSRSSERYSVLDICLLNPKQHRRSKNCGNDADSATNRILVCCGLRLQCTKCTVWPCIFHQEIDQKPVKYYQK